MESIVMKLNNLVANLPKSSQVYRDYFHTLAEALENRDLAKMEELWLAVDIAWVKIGPENRLIPAHMMEDGYHDSYRVSPEFRMMWRTEDFQEELNITRDAIIEFGGQFGNEAIDKVNRTDVGVFLTLAFSGCNTDFRMAGQSVPNRTEAQTIGMKVFLDSDSMLTGAKKSKVFNSKVLSAKTWEWFEKAHTAQYDYFLVFGHELGHPLGVTAEVNSIFGTDKPTVEEAKATLFGVHAVFEALKKGKLGDKQIALRSLTAEIIHETLGRFKKSTFENPTFAPYASEGMIPFSVLYKAGIISFDEEDKVVVDEELASTECTFELLQKYCVERLATAYKNVDLQEIRAIAVELANREDPAIKKAFEAINKNLLVE